MENLAKHSDVVVPEIDSKVFRELTRCGINPVAHDEKIRGEVPTCHTGELCGFTFKRAWYYWVVEGKMPLAQANELYNTAVGKTDIRAGGDCGCRPPETWLTYFAEDGKEVCPAEDLDKLPPKILNKVKERFVFDDVSKYPAFVTTYHVDSELGLYILAEKIRGLRVEKDCGVFRKEGEGECSKLDRSLTNRI